MITILPPVSPLASVLVFVPLSIGLLLWFCFPPGDRIGRPACVSTIGPADPAAGEQQSARRGADPGLDLVE